MLISVPNVFSAGAVIIASQHNANFSTIANVINGGLDNTNLTGSAGITYANLTLTGKIVNADIASGAGITAAKLNLTTGSAIGTTSPAEGKFTMLEATTSLKLGTTNQGDILYDNGTSLVRLTPGTSGQLLKTQGASANPVWVDAPVATALGTWASATADGGAHQVTTDGFLVVNITPDTTHFARVVVLSDSSNPPTTLRGNAIATDNTGAAGATVTTPVKKNDYYKITVTGTGATTTAAFIPLGT